MFVVWPGRYRKDFYRKEVSLKRGYTNIMVFFFFQDSERNYLIHLVCLDQIFQQYTKNYWNTVFFKKENNSNNKDRANPHPSLSLWNPWLDRPIFRKHYVNEPCSACEPRAPAERGLVGLSWKAASSSVWNSLPLLALQGAETQRYRKRNTLKGVWSS